MRIGILIFALILAAALGFGTSISIWASKLKKSNDIGGSAGNVTNFSKGADFMVSMDRLSSKEYKDFSQQHEILLPPQSEPGALEPVHRIK